MSAQNIVSSIEKGAWDETKGERAEIHTQATTVLEMLGHRKFFGGRIFTRDGIKIESRTLDHAGYMLETQVRVLEGITLVFQTDWNRAYFEKGKWTERLEALYKQALLKKTSRE